MIDTDPAAAFKQALREEMDALFEAAARSEARFLTGKWCPTEEEIQVLLPYTRRVLELQAEGKIPCSGEGE